MHAIRVHQIVSVSRHPPTPFYMLGVRVMKEARDMLANQDHAARLDYIGR